MNTIRAAALAFLCLLAGCVTPPTEDADSELTLRPAGVIRRVNAPERYVLFESAHNFEAGHTLRAMREGRSVATLRVHPLRHRPFQAADILDGAPREGDLVE